jgi:nucleoredoxin
MKTKDTLLLAAVLCVFAPSRVPAVTLEEVVADPQQWPAEVIVTATTKGGVIKNGQVSGMMLIGAGKKLVVTGLAADGVTGKLGGATVKVAVDKTDLMQRLNGGGPAPEITPPVDPVPEAAAATGGATAATGGATSAMQRLFGGKLVRYAGGRLQNVESAALAGVKYYALYYSASWCGPCRQFTPGLVSAYRELKQKHPEFEVIFVSADHSAGDMLGYMHDDRMAWPAVRFDRREQKMIDYSGPGIPCLVLVDANGRVLSDSYRGDEYIGPNHVLSETRKILARGR